MNVRDYAEERRLSIKQLMDFTTCVNPLGPSTSAKTALRMAIKEIDIPADTKSRYLTRLIARKEKIDEAHIVIGQGSSHLLYSALKASETMKVLIPGPVSRKFSCVVSRSNATLKSLPFMGLHPFSIDIGEITAAMDDVDAVILPYPHDMVGAAPSPEDLRVLISETGRLGKTLILDESLRDFTILPSPINDVIASNHVIIVRTFSVFHALTGLPIGYAIGATDLMERIRKSIFPIPINTLATHAAVVSIRDTAHAIRTRTFINDEKSFLLKGLTSITDLSVRDTLCPFFVLRIEKERKAFEELFLRYRILIDDFFEGKDGQFLRVPVKKHKWNARFLKTIRNAFGVYK